MSKSVTVDGGPSSALGFRGYWDNLRTLWGLIRLLVFFPTFVDDEAQRKSETEESKSEKRR